MSTRQEKYRHRKTREHIHTAFLKHIYQVEKPNIRIYIINVEGQKLAKQEPRLKDNTNLSLETNKQVI